LSNYKQNDMVNSYEQKSFNFIRKTVSLVWILTQYAVELLID